jgi:hypothetical protein
MRKALIVGIDHYAHLTPLYGCVRDASELKSVLERHADEHETVNFAHPRLMTGTGPTDLITRTDLKEATRELFESHVDIALFYFAGHGHIEETGGYLCAGDCKSGDDGFPLVELMKLVSKSKARNNVIILDSCHSGIAGDKLETDHVAEIHEGTTILTASTANQYAREDSAGGLFTALLLDALRGAAANLVGDVTPGSVYAHIDQSLGPWAQRPVFKTNVKTFVSLRRAKPPISLAQLRNLATLFPEKGVKFKLDPSYEPERPAKQEEDLPPPDAAKTAIFGVLQAYARVNLVRPVDAPHMWHAAMWSKSCELTALGEHYRALVAKNLI